MSKKYQIAGKIFEISGEELLRGVACIEGFKAFEVQSGDASFGYVEGNSEDIPEIEQALYTFEYEDVNGTFGRTDAGFALVLKPAEESTLTLWVSIGNPDECFVQGNWSARLLRFAMWIGFGLMMLKHDTLAIHSSCIVYKDKAVLFLGESGTGKSTHTRLWREHIEGAMLLNDDSPMIRVEDGKVWAYGSAWSGKTPCYKNKRYELKACVRLSQAPYNKIQKLPVLQAYGAIHPSCAPEFAYDDKLYDEVSRIIGKILSVVPFYHLACLPNEEACLLSCKTIFE